MTAKTTWKCDGCGRRYDIAEHQYYQSRASHSESFGFELIIYCSTPCYLPALERGEDRHYHRCMAAMDEFNAR